MCKKKHLTKNTTKKQCLKIYHKHLFFNVIPSNSNHQKLTTCYNTFVNSYKFKQLVLAFKEPQIFSELLDIKISGTIPQNYDYILCLQMILSHSLIYMHSTFIFVTSFKSTRRYSPLPRPSSSSCKGLMSFRAKKKFCLHAIY